MTPSETAKLHGIISRLFGMPDEGVLACRVCREVVFLPRPFGLNNHVDACPVRDLMEMAQTKEVSDGN